MAEVTQQQARDACDRLGIIVDRRDGKPPTLMQLFEACESLDITPPDELLEWIDDATLLAAGYTV